MSAKSHQTDYFGINSTKIYSANPSGNFTVTSLPLTRRHLQDLESPSHYNLLFDLIANKFSRSPLHRRSTQQIHTPIQASTEASRRPRPVLSATKSAEAVLTPQRRQHQQGRGCKKFAPEGTRVPDSSSSSTGDQVNIAVQNKQRSRTVTVTPADTPIASPFRTRPLNSPYESPSRIGARSVGALLSLPEHTHHNQQLNVQHQQSPVRVRSAEVILPRHNTILCGFHRLRLSTTASANPILPSQVQNQRPQAPKNFRPPQRIFSRNLSSTTSLPAPAMAPEHPHHLDPDSPDPFTAFGNPHQKTTLSPHKESIFSFRNVKKALRIGAADKKGEQKRQDRAEKCSKKIGRENAEAATRAEREQKEGAEKMRKLEKEAEKQRWRREEQAVNMEKKRRREEEKERIMEVRRHERALGGMSWGFDPGAGTRASRESGSGDHACHCPEGSDEPGGGEGSGFQRFRRGTTWGVTGGGPGKVGGYHGSDASRS
jgi:hypothetical protein